MIILEDNETPKLTDPDEDEYNQLSKDSQINNTSLSNKPNL
jgi:hypothetical protein